MINLINSWATQIVVAVIIVTILELIIPQGNNKKYIKTIIGIYILLIMLNPIISNFIDKNTFETILTSYSFEGEKDESKKSKLKYQTNIEVNKLYEKKIKEQITCEIENIGYIVKNIDLEIETKSEEEYGKILKVEVKILKLKTYENNTIKPIEINIENSTNESKYEKISEQEIEDIKQMIEKNYGIDKENITIERNDK